MDAWMDGWVEGWTEESFRSAFKNKVLPVHLNLNPQCWQCFCFKGCLMADLGAMSKGPKWSGEWIKQLQPGQCCQKYHQSFDIMVVSSSPSLSFQMPHS